MMQLFLDCGSIPLVMIRFNPDSYTEGSKRVAGCFDRSSCAVREKEWKRRYAVLEQVVGKALTTVPEQEVSVMKFFYSEDV